jgi:hypothetical protein
VIWLTFQGLTFRWLCYQLLTICWSDLFHGPIIEFSSWKLNIAQPWLLYNGDNYMNKIEWPCLNIVQVEWNFNSWRNFKSFNNSNTFQYSSSNRRDTLLIPILLAWSSLVTHLPPTSHYALHSTSLKISTTVIFGGIGPSLKPHQTLHSPYKIHDLQATISYFGMCIHSSIVP